MTRLDNWAGAVAIVAVVFLAGLIFAVLLCVGRL